MSKSTFSWRRFWLGVLFMLTFWSSWAVLREHYGLAWDAHGQRCLPLSLAWLVKNPQTNLKRGDLVYFAPFGALSRVREPVIIKQVAGMPGDQLEIRGDAVLINGRQVARGFPFLRAFHTTLSAVQRREIIPAGRLFVIGTQPGSMDSRYWGYLPQSRVKGKAYALV